MIEIFTRIHFKEMPWKNGSGVTTEIFRIPNPDNESFFFRISKAQVSTDGPFSLFPNIDRIIVLLKGSGFNLKSSEHDILLNKKLSPFYFKGEEVMRCTLENGPCTDFNVMTDRSYANTTISVINSHQDDVITIKAECDLKFIYDMEEETLIKLSLGDSYDLRAKSKASYIVIDTTIL